MSQCTERVTSHTMSIQKPWPVQRYCRPTNVFLSGLCGSSATCSATCSQAPRNAVIHNVSCLQDSFQWAALASPKTQVSYSCKIRVCDYGWDKEDLLLGLLHQWEYVVNFTIYFWINLAYYCGVALTTLW